LPARAKQIEDLQAAVHRHFTEYAVTSVSMSSFGEFPDNVALAFCDQIGDDGSSDCNDIMVQSIQKNRGVEGSHSVSQSFASHESKGEASSQPAKTVLKYTPVKYLDCKAPTNPDFGPEPNLGALKGLGQHLQVAMEVSCTNLILRCAYANKDFSIPAKAIALGLLGDTEGKAQALEKGIEDGAARVRKSEIGAFDEKKGCDTLPSQEKQIEDLKAAVHTHFSAYGVSPMDFLNYHFFADDLSLAFCDQIGDDGSTPCGEMMREGLSEHLAA